MKSKRRWLLLLPVLALFAWAWQAASWRPKLIGVQSIGPYLPPQTQLIPYQTSPQLWVSPNGHQLLSISDGDGTFHLTMWATSSHEKLWHRSRVGERQWMLDFSPDNRLLAIAADDPVSTTANITLLLVEAASGKQLRPQTSSYHFDERLQSAAFLSNHELVVATEWSARVIDIQTGKTRRRWKFQFPRLSADESPRSYVSPDGTTVLVLIYRDGRTHGFVYDARTGQLRHQWIGGSSVYSGLRLSPDGKLWAAQNSENCCIIHVHETATGKPAWRRDIEIGNTVQTWDWSADSQSLLSASWSGTLLTNKNNERNPIRLPGPSDAIAVTLVRDGDYFYSLDKQSKIWRWRAR